MKFFTSRYTAALEDQVKEQKEEILRLRQQNTELAALIVKQGATESPKPKAVDKDKPKWPRSVNWLQGRHLLETPNLDVREAPPEKERTANGSR